MADSSSRGPASFTTQANALLRKNLTFQKRNCKSNAVLVGFPILLCSLILALQIMIKHVSHDSNLEYSCGCACVTPNADGTCAKTECGIQYSNLSQMPYCAIPSPPQWPPLLQIPRFAFSPFTDLPEESCRKRGSCPATVLLTGGNQSFGESVAKNLFNSGLDNLNSSHIFSSLANLYLGSDIDSGSTNLLDPAFISDSPIYDIHPQCSPNSTFFVPIQIASFTIQQEVRCLPSLHLWRTSSSVINDEIFKGYQNGNSEGKFNKIVTAYDFLNSDENNFNVSIWYNSNSWNDDQNGVPAIVRAPRLVNVVSNAYLQFLRGADVKIIFDFVKEMPKPSETSDNRDFLSALAPLLFTWVILQLFPVILASLVYEKQQKLRIMMKMHGLGDGPYWMITYAYFFFLSLAYMSCLVVFGSSIGLKFFTMNSYSIQFLFYFLYINLQISFAFLGATIFSNVKTATVIGHIYVFGSGLLGSFLFQDFVQNTSFPRVQVILMEILPCFSLYRGLYEFGQYASTTDGMLWKDLSTNGMGEVLIIIVVEWFLVLPVAYYFDQVVSIGSGVRKHPLFFLDNVLMKPSPSIQLPSLQRQVSGLSVQMEKVDVSLERKKVEQLLNEPDTNYAIICDNLKKMYPRKDGNPEKFAVRGLSLALPRGECFGMLGPNGAGKTSSINMMIGLLTPTSGTSFVHGLDIRKDMDKIYTSMGVCPQHDLLWETLTGREHLLFYGRLKNLKGAALTQAVEESLKGVSLIHGGVGDKQAGKYSGGMKRRLSVAISLIGDPKVVYMDEPSSGLDPASRNVLWDVVKHAKKNCAVILTTHSMEEADVLCDRLGIFVDGSLQCIGYPAELKARYGGHYVFTMTTSPSHEKEVENLIRQLSPRANKIYHLSGTQKFELPKDEVRIADVFQAVENAKRAFPIHDWGLVSTTLEDVFIKVARGAQAFDVLS